MQSKQNSSQVINYSIQPATGNLEALSNRVTTFSKLDIKYCQNSIVIGIFVKSLTFLQNLLNDIFCRFSAKCRKLRLQEGEGRKRNNVYETLHTTQACCSFYVGLSRPHKRPILRYRMTLLHDM